MRKIAVISLLLLLSLAVLGGCSKGGSSSGSPAGGADVPTISGSDPVDKLESMIGQMTDIMEKANGDAVAAAAGLNAYYLKNKDAVNNIKTGMEQLQKNPMKAMAKLQKLAPKMQKWIQLIQKFEKDAKFIASMNNFKMNLFGK